MDGFSVGLGLLIAGAVIAFLARPWWTRQEGQETGLDIAPAQGATTELLDERYEAFLTTLRDLDFDHAVGKVAEEDYAPLRHALLVEVAEMMAQLDKRTAAEGDFEMRFEAEILALRQDQRIEFIELDRDDAIHSPAGGGACPICGRTSRPGDLFCAACGTSLNPACPECEHPVDVTDRFCAGCGAKLVPYLA